MLKSSRKKVTAALVAAALVAAAVALAVGTAAATHSHRVGTRSAVLPHGLADRIESNRRALARSFPLLTAAHAASVRALSLPEPFQREFAEQATKSVPAGALGEPDPAMAVYIGQVSSAATGALNVWAMPGPNDYGNLITHYLEGRGIGWVAWVFDPEWQPALLQSWDHFELTGSGEFFKKALHEMTSK